MGVSGSLVMAAVAALCLALPVRAAAPLRLENERLAVEFDPGTGAWTALVDKATGEDLA